MQTYRTPGVYIEHVLPEPARVFRTGVPVFLGLIRRQDLRAYNIQQSDSDEQYVEPALSTFPRTYLTRKRGYLKLPGRPASSTMAVQQSDPSAADRTFYLRYIPGDQSKKRDRQVRVSSGAAGRPGGLATEDPEQLPAMSEKPQRFTAWPQFELTYGDLTPFGFLNYAVRGFFENEGNLCYVQLISFEGDSPLEALLAGLKSLEAYDDFDLICVPDMMWPPSATAGIDHMAVHAMQMAVLRHCDVLGDRFALLDALLGADSDHLLAQRQALTGENGALYYPWLGVRNGPAVTNGFVPPCGHVAGVIARTDQQRGVHKAPANERLEGVVDLAEKLTDEQQGTLNEANLNALRAFPRRGIRIWGARTLSQQVAWRYINVRRIFLTAGRWIERNMTDVLFEPNTPELWGRIVRDLTMYFTELLEQGALAGRSAQEAFYVKCDAETNPPTEREIGHVVTEIGLAPAATAEFIVVRLIHGPSGVRILGPT